MKIVIQRVKGAKVTAKGRKTAEIKGGILLFVGVGRDDKIEDIGRVCEKIANLRIFEDEGGKMNLNVRQAGGSVLSVSQFTLCADVTKGNRPGFDAAAERDTAERHWAALNAALREKGIEVKEGVFGARMEVELINDGPVTIII